MTGFGIGLGIGVGVGVGVGVCRATAAMLPDAMAAMIATPTNRKFLLKCPSLRGGTVPNGTDFVPLGTVPPSPDLA